MVEKERQGLGERKKRTQVLDANRHSVKQSLHATGLCKLGVELACVLLGLFKEH